MTNSTPKLRDKVERQGSPNSTAKPRQQHCRSASVKSSMFSQNGGRHGKNSANSGGGGGGGTSGRLSCSPPCGSLKSTRSSPLRTSECSPRGSPTNSFYAGAKFSEPPSPASLPKPPSHWTTRLLTGCQQSAAGTLSNHSKVILNVQA